MQASIDLVVFFVVRLGLRFLLPNRLMTQLLMVVVAKVVVPLTVRLEASWALPTAPAAMLSVVIDPRRTPSAKIPGA